MKAAQEPSASPGLIAGIVAAAILAPKLRWWLLPAALFVAYCGAAYLASLEVFQAGTALGW